MACFILNMMSRVWPTIFLNCYTDYIWYFFDEQLSPRNLYFTKKIKITDQIPQCLFILGSEKYQKKNKKILPQLDQEAQH